MHNDSAPLVLPQLLRELPRWNRWRIAQNKQGKWTKVPDESTRNRGRSFDDTDGPSTAEEGRGFVFTGGIDVPAGRVMSIDLDACRNPNTGTIEPWANYLLDGFGRSYTEITPSGCGLRVWFICAKPPAAHEFSRVKVKVAKERAPGVPETKSVEWQLFGYGVPQFVTVTGNHLPGTKVELLVVPDLEALDREWQILRKGPTRVDGSALPAGEGPMPSLDAVEHRIDALAEPMRSAVLDANWRPLLGDDERDVSASAAFYRVVQNVLRAAHGHGAGALAFLLSRTAWGRGEVEESADPSRYARETWVAAELARIGAKTTTPTGALFDDGFKVENWAPPVAAPIERKVDGLLQTATQFLAVNSSDAFLVYQVLPRVGLARFFGDPGCGKTPVAISLSVAVATGQETWFGHEVDRSGVVVYMIGEDAGGIRNRVRAELAKRSLDPAECPIYFTTRPGALSSPADVETWLQAIQKLIGAQRVALFVVDTQARNFGDADENSTQDAGTFITNCQRLADSLQCCLALVHHTGHANKDRGRGSFAVYGALDAEFRVERTGKAAITVSSVKAKNWEAQTPMRGTLEVLTVGQDRKGRPVTAVTLGEHEPDPAAVFQELTPDHVDVLRVLHKLAGAKAARSAIGAATGLGRTRVGEILDELTSWQLIHARGAKAKGARLSYLLSPQAIAEVEKNGEKAL